MVQIMKELAKRFLFVLLSFLKEIERKKQWEDYMSLCRQFKQMGKTSYFSYMDYDITGAQYIEIGEQCKFGHRLRLNAYDKFGTQNFSPRLQIGNGVLIGNDCHIGCIEHVQIGNGVLMASKILIIDHQHGNTTGKESNLSPQERPLHSKPIVIGDNVWIGEGVAIMPGVEIGDNVIIGANAVVTHSFPKNVVIAGVPAKIIKVLDID